MKKIFSVFLFFNIIGILFSADRIVVLDFKAVNAEKMIAEAATEILSTAIVSSNTFSVIERSQLNQLMNELKLSASDDFDDNQALEIGKLAKADMVLLGSITKIGEMYSVNARLIEVSTGTIKTAKRISTDSVNNLNDAINELAFSFNPNYKSDSSSKKVENITVDTTNTVFIKSSDIKFKKTKVSARPKKKNSLFNGIALTSHFNDTEINYIRINFRDKTEIEIVDSIKIPSDISHVIRFSGGSKEVSRIRIEAVTDRSSTRSWKRANLTVSGRK